MNFEKVKKVLMWLSNILFLLLILYFNKEKLGIEKYFPKKIFNDNTSFYIFLVIIIVLPLIINIDKFKKFFDNQEKVTEYLENRDQFELEKRKEIDKKIGYIEPKKLYIVLISSIILFILSILIDVKITILIILLFWWLAWDTTKKWNKK